MRFEYIISEEEAEMLREFEEKANKGQIVEVSEIREAYEKLVGHKTAPAHIYAVLKRHNWTKKIPRSRHPKKASKEAIETSKKINLIFKKEAKNADKATVRLMFQNEAGFGRINKPKYY